MDIRREERPVRGGKGENTTGERSESSRKGTNRRDDLSAVRARDITIRNIAYAWNEAFMYRSTSSWDRNTRTQVHFSDILYTYVYAHKR